MRNTDRCRSLIERMVRVRSLWKDFLKAAIGQGEIIDRIRLEHERVAGCVSNLKYGSGVSLCADFKKDPRDGSIGARIPGL